MRQTKLIGSLGLGILSLAACTGQLPQSFRYTQQEQSFPDQQKINTKIDLLWVVDNSSSMDVSQKALRDKFAGFARKYLKPYWDIRVAVITTDAYLANPVFQNYLGSTLPGSTGYKSKHLADFISMRAAAGATSSNDAKFSLLSGLGVSLTADVLTAGYFLNGIKYQDLVPAWSRGRDYARLLPGVHDGPIPGLCVERQPYFISDDNVSYPNVNGPQCKIRDTDYAAGVANCLNPASGTTSVSQCVNTFLNDTVHSGYPIISTKPDASVTDMDAWVQTLIDRFTVNVSTGSSGGGSERGLGSVLEFLDANETSATAFFRKDSLRGIIFVSDEDDQTMNLPTLASVTAGFTPDTNYACDLGALVDANTGKFANASNYIQNQYKYCCAAGNGCALVNTGCPSRTIDGYTYKVGVCPDESKLMPVTDVKTRLDSFFLALDGAEATNPNYFVMAIVANSATTIQALQSARYQSDDKLDILPFYNGSGSVVTQQRLRLPAVDRGWRYAALAESVGNGSLTLDIGSPDYSVLLDNIGKTIVEKKSVFNLTFAPTTKDDMIVKVVHADGTSTVLANEQFEFSGKTLTIVDQAFVLSLSETDNIVINYQPKSLD